MSLQNFTEFFNLQSLVFDFARNALAVVGLVWISSTVAQWCWRQIRFNTVRAVSACLIVGCVVWLASGDAFGAGAAHIPADKSAFVPYHAEPTEDMRPSCPDDYVAGGKKDGDSLSLIFLCMAGIAALICLALLGICAPVVATLGVCALMLTLICDVVADASIWFSTSSPPPAIEQPVERRADVINARTLQKAMDHQAEINLRLIEHQAGIQRHEARTQAQFMHRLKYGGMIVALVVVWAIVMRWLGRRERNQADQDQGRVIERVIYIREPDQAGRIVPVGRQLAGSRGTEVTK